MRSGHQASLRSFDGCRRPAAARLAADRSAIFVNVALSFAVSASIDVGRGHASRRRSCTQLRGGPRLRHRDRHRCAERAHAVRASSARCDPTAAAPPRRCCVIITVVTGRAGVRAQARQLLLEVGARQRIERAERLVEKQHLRLGRERSRNRDPLPHAARQLARPPVDGVAEADLVEIRARLLGLSRRAAIRETPPRRRAARSRAPRTTAAASSSETRSRRRRCIPRTGSPPNRTSPASGVTRPAMMFRSVDLPHPMKPTIETNSPCVDRQARRARARAARTAPVPNVFEIAAISMKRHSRRSSASSRPCPSGDRARSR